VIALAERGFGGAGFSAPSERAGRNAVERTLRPPGDHRGTAAGAAAEGTENTSPCFGTTLPGYGGFV
jgi:hypothetical protein